MSTKSMGEFRVHGSGYRYLEKMAGLTLIELMLALMLTMLILSGLSVIYLAAAKNHLAEDALQTIQQNARIAFQQLNSAVRAAGYVGCAALRKDFSVVPFGAYAITKETRIQAYLGNEVRAGTDAFTVRYANAMSGTLVAAMNALNVLHITASPKMGVGDVLLIADCKTAEIFSIQSVSVNSDGTQTIVTEKELAKRYDPYAEVSELEINTFYIGKTGRKDSGGANVYALYVKDKAGRATELVEGVNKLQIRYALSEEGKIVEVSPDEVSDWSLVGGVSFRLDLGSLNYFPLQKTEYSYVALRNL